MSIAQTIAEQIGQKAFVMMGTKQKVADKDSLSFDIHGCRKWNKINIQLMPNDTYTVTFYKITPKRFTEHSVNDVYVDTLHHVIEIHTGLYLSL